LGAGVLRADAHIGGERGAHAGAGGDTVDRRDHRLVEVMPHLGPAADPAVLVEAFGLGGGRGEVAANAGLHGGEIGAGAEAAACAGDDQGADLVVGMGLFHRGGDVGAHRGADSV
jgi:hypothetical protein